MGFLSDLKKFRVWGLSAGFLAVFGGTALVFVLFPQIDLWFSRQFFIHFVGFFLKDHPLVRFFYSFVEVAALGAVIFIVLTLIFRWRDAGLRRKIIFLALVLALGPGLMVNTILKGGWGRARPAQVACFGGAKLFSPAFLISDQCERNCSFVSGHAAMGFYFSAFALVFPLHRKKWMAAGIALGSLVGISRIAQGGHFLSDVIFAFFFVHAVAVIVHYWMFGGMKKKGGPDETVLSASSLIGIVLAVLSYFYWDISLAKYFHSLDRTPWIMPFKVLTDLGKGQWFLIPAGVMYLSCRKKEEKTAKAALFILSIVAVAGVVGAGLKMIAGRARPVLLFSQNIYGFHFFKTASDYTSFPSGHSATLMAVMMSIALFHPRYKYFCLAFGFLMAFTRTATTAHYFSDVCIGAVLGMLIAWSFHSLFYGSDLPHGPLLEKDAYRIETAKPAGLLPG